MNFDQTKNHVRLTEFTEFIDQLRKCLYSCAVPAEVHSRFGCLLLRCYPEWVSLYMVSE